MLTETPKSLRLVHQFSEKDYPFKATIPDLALRHPESRKTIRKDIAGTLKKCGLHDFYILSGANHFQTFFKDHIDSLLAEKLIHAILEPARPVQIIYAICPGPLTDHVRMSAIAALDEYFAETGFKNRITFDYEPIPRTIRATAISGTSFIHFCEDWHNMDPVRRAAIDFILNSAVLNAPRPPDPVRYY